MLNALLGYSLARRMLVMFAAAGLAVAGGWAFRQLKLEAYPDISDPSVVVITQYPGFAAEEVEQQVTIPIERALNNTPNVISRRSRTIFGLSVVELTFEDRTNDYFARQVVLEKLRDATLPDGVTPTLGPLSTGISEFYRYVLESDGFDAMQLRELQDWVVVPRLLQVPGVADVANFGGLVRQYQIEIDPNALTKYRFSVRQIADAVKNNNRNAGGSLLELGEQSLAIRGSGLVQTSDDLSSIVLDSQKGVPIFVRDVGRVTVGHLPQTGIFQLNRQHSQFGGVEGIALMRRWENPSEVLRDIHAAVDDINATTLPQGVRIVPIHDRTELVQHTLAGGLILLYLRSINLSVSAAVGFISLFGVAVMSGLLYVADINARRRTPGLTLTDAVVQGARVQFRPRLVLIVVAVLGMLPAALARGIGSDIQRPLATVVVGGLIATLILTLLALPAIYVLADRLRSRESPAAG